jgi:hypothetical protein
MKNLLDECVPRGLKRRLPGHEVQTVPEAGWSGIKNGRLLTLAQESFEVFLTVDQNIPHQQNLPQFRIAVLVVPAPSNDINDILPFAPAILAALPLAKPGQAIALKAS